jgi:hypothetical protein
MPRKQSGGDQVERSPNAMNARSPMVLQVTSALSSVNGANSNQIILQI